AAAGDTAARDELLERNRPRLRQMVALRLDPRLGPRLDASDVVQETLVEAVRKLPEYLARRPLPFYPRLRQLALDRAAEAYRRNVQAGKRSVTREELPLPDDSVVTLAERLLDRGSSPSAGLQQAELRQRVLGALQQLGERDREVLVLRHLEQLSTSETAAVLGITESSVKGRLLRAVDRFRQQFGEDAGEGLS